MDTNNWREAQGQVQMSGQVIGGDAVPPGGMEGGDWRTQLQQESRQRIVNKIMETLKRHLPFSGQEGLQELKKIAVRFEEKIYTAATSQSDYLRKISFKMLTIETKSQNPMANSLQSNAAATSQNPQDPDFSSQTVSANGGDWQEEIYQKLKSMHEMYYPELNEMYQQMVAKLQKHDAIPQQPKNEQLEKLRFLKLMLERLIMFLRTNKNDIQPNHKEKIVGVEKQIVNILNSNRPRKPASSLQQGQLAQPHMHAMHQSQQQQPPMSQMPSNEFSDSSSQTVSANGGDWQEEIYQKLKSMHEMYYPELNEMYQRMVAKLQKHDAIPQQPKNEQLEKLRFLNLMLERLIMFLRTNKNDIQPNHKEKIVGVEKQIVNILNSNRPRKPVSSLQQGQLAQPHMHAMHQSQQQQPPMSQMHSNEFSGAIDEHAGFLSTNGNECFERGNHMHN